MDGDEAAVTHGQGQAQAITGSPRDAPGKRRRIDSLAVTGWLASHAADPAAPTEDDFWRCGLHFAIRPTSVKKKWDGRCSPPVVRRRDVGALAARFRAKAGQAAVLGDFSSAHVARTLGLEESTYRKNYRADLARELELLRAPTTGTWGKNPEALRMVLDEVAGARREVIVGVFSATHNLIVAALLAARARQPPVRVVVIADPDNMWTEASQPVFSAFIQAGIEVFTPKPETPGVSGMHSKRIVVDRRRVIEASHNQGVNAYGKDVGDMPSNIESSTHVTDAAFAERCAMDMLHFCEVGGVQVRDTSLATFGGKTSSGKIIGRAPTAHPGAKVPRKTAAEKVHVLDALPQFDWDVTETVRCMVQEPGYSNLTVQKVVGWLGRQETLRAAVEKTKMLETQRELRLTCTRKAMPLSTILDAPEASPSSPLAEQPQLLCKYSTDKCPNPRATKSNGKLLLLCQFHRDRQNEHFRTWQRKERDRDALANQEASFRNVDCVEVNETSTQSTC